MQRAVAKCDRYQTRWMLPSKTTRLGEAGCRLSPCEVERDGVYSTRIQK